MNPYRATYRSGWEHDPAAPSEFRAITEPVVVVGGYYEPLVMDPNRVGEISSWGGYRVVAIAQAGGRLITDGIEAFTCTEPGYLGLPLEPEADHEHKLGVGQVILEGGRQVGIERRCTHPGCQYAERSNPTRKAAGER